MIHAAPPWTLWILLVIHFIGVPDRVAEIEGRHFQWEVSQFFLFLRAAFQFATKEGEGAFPLLCSDGDMVWPIQIIANVDSYIFRAVGFLEDVPGVVTFKTSLKDVAYLA